MNSAAHRVLEFPKHRNLCEAVRSTKATPTVSNQGCRTAALIGCLLLAVLFLLHPMRAAAQEYRGTISGTVTDPTGAVIPGAKVTVTETTSGTTSRTISNSAGQYALPFLAPGTYTIAVKKEGFKTTVHGNIALLATEHLVINEKMQIGSSSETVNVTAATPLLNTANASIGQVITTREVADLPLDGRTPMMLTELSIGVMNTAQPGQARPFDNNAAADWSISGTASQTSEILMDGSPDELWNYTLAYSPPMSAVQEVSVQAFSTDAAFGHTQAGVINQVLKSGTNSLHGQLYEYGQVSALDANTWFNDLKNVPTPLTHFNQYGAEASGPVVIPHVFNGKDKLFWLVAWEGLQDSEPTTDLATVPTQAERTGDFSALLPLGCTKDGGVQTGNPGVCADGTANPYQLYNPFTATLSSNGTITRQPIPDNNLASAGISIDPVAANYLNYYPAPNTTADTNGQYNYISNAPSVDNYNNFLARIDDNLGDSTHIFADARYNDRLQVKENYFNNAATGDTLDRLNWGATVDAVHTFNPSTVLDLRLNWTYFLQTEGEPSDGLSPTTLGFPSSVAANSQHLQMPYIAFTGSCGSQSSYQCLGGTSYSRVPSQSEQLFGDLMKTIGNHSIKMGVDAREYRLSAISNKYPDGDFTFDDQWVLQTSSAASQPFGGDLAEFMMGLPDQGYYDNNAESDFHTYYVGAFAQDDWRLSPTLTLNLGVRFDHDSPYYEKFGRVVNGFNTTAQNPVAGTAEAAYASDPLSQLPASQFHVLGGLTFPGSNNGAYYQTDSHWFSPRIGFDWSPQMLDNKTVVRGGFGMFVSQYTIANLDPEGTWNSSPILNSEGFSSTTTFVPSTNNYLSPAATLSNPFPNGYQAPTGSSLGLATDLGQDAVSFMDPHPTDPYSLRWDIGIQQSLTPDTMFEIDYVGNHLVHEPVASVQYNYIPRQFMATGPTRAAGQTAITALTSTVTNPFHGISQMQGTTVGDSSSISAAQLLSRFPEFETGEDGANQEGSNNSFQGVLEDNDTIGQSFFNALDARIDKRMSGGLWLVANYSWSKLEDQNVFMNDTDPDPTKDLSPFNATNHFSAGVTYDLPFGAGQRFAVSSHWLNELASGWVINAINIDQTGFPVYWSYDMVTTGQPVSISMNEKDIRNKTSVFDNSAFDLNGSDQFEYHIRTFPLTIPGVRADGMENLDSSILKNFPIRDDMRLQLRFETFNTLNHPEFSAPGVDPTSGFGVITSQANTQRQIQFGGELYF